MIEKFYKDNYKSLLNYAIRHTGEVQLAMDIVHDTFVWALVKENEINSSISPTGWLFNTLKNIIGNEYQKKGKRQFEYLHEGMNYTYAAPCCVYEVLPQRLPLVDKELLAMRYEKCYSIGDIAATLGIKESACRKRISRAINYCRHELGE